MNRTRRRVAILSATIAVARQDAAARGIDLNDMIHPRGVAVLRAAPRIEIIVPPTFESHPAHDELADYLRDMLNPTPTRFGRPLESTPLGDRHAHH